MLTAIRRARAPRTRALSGSPALRLLPVLALLALTPAALAQPLEAGVRQIFEAAKLKSCRVSVHAVDVDTRETILDFETDPSKPGFIPASNMKLLTTGAALQLLGPDYEFLTRFVVRGDTLVIVGCGDPAFADPVLLKEMGTSVDGFLDRLVTALRRVSPGGIRQIIVDDRIFDRDYVHHTWPTDQLNRGYCAQVCGLNFHANIVHLYASPGSGASPRVDFEPQGSIFRFDNRLQARSSGNNAVWVERPGDANSFIVSGSIRGALEVPVEVTVHEPSTVFASLLAERIRRAGLAESTPQVRLAGADEVTEAGAGQEFALVRTPLSVVLKRCNTDSENLYAESLLKLIGHLATSQPGSWENGAAALRMEIRRLLGPGEAAEAGIADGSGMSRENNVTAPMLADWLVAMQSNRKIGEAFLASLATPGEGTFERRFRQNRLSGTVHAKSGYIRGVRTLSGYLVHPGSGRRIAFSILVNDVPGDVPGTRVKEFHEDVVRAIDGMLQREAVAEANGEREAVGG